jgi:hypothetical protein
MKIPRRKEKSRRNPTIKPIGLSERRSRDGGGLGGGVVNPS